MVNISVVRDTGHIQLLYTFQRKHSMITYVYWIHLPNHNDIYREGYVNVSNKPRRRLNEHTNSNKNRRLYRAIEKYKDQIIQTIIFEGKEVSCFALEETLRPFKFIGWNINKGGNKPPSRKGWHPTLETLKKRSKNLKGIHRTEDWCKKLSDAKKGSKNPNYGIKLPCTMQRRLAVIYGKNIKNYNNYKSALILMKSGMSADQVSIQLSIGRGVCFKLKNGSHMIFEAFPELKQFLSG